MKDYEELKGLNFAVGPVEMDEETRKLGSINLPYFRTKEFSDINKENEKLIKKLIDSEETSRAIFLTTSGTGAMEATIMNIFDGKNKVLVINGGSFGTRFKEICDIHGIENIEVKLECGQKLSREILEKYSVYDIDGVVVNLHETSTGVLYDMEIISDFCNKKNVILVVDAISSFLADKYSMKKYNADITIIGSQKGLGLPPGLAIVVASERAIKKIEDNKIKSLYFDFKRYLIDGERGQTPFTPAVGIIIQLNNRLNNINEKGINNIIRQTAELAEYFRSRIKKYPFEIASENMSNAMTSLYVTGKMKAHDLFEYLKNEYSVYLCPNGGLLKDKMIRVGHMGNLTKEDIDKLYKIFDEMMEEKLI